MTTDLPGKEEVAREFPPLGKYRVRLLRHPKTGAKVLDIREYVSGESFEGFTRRGIRLGDLGQLDLLRDVLAELVRERLV
ncbi:MAG: hypothetical protein JO332_02810 [Planctomycetaceae bacterium]|nr:hypothetical protein [Planctomycetaceae bacterium]